MKLKIFKTSDPKIQNIIGDLIQSKPYVYLIREHYLFKNHAYLYYKYCIHLSDRSNQNMKSLRFSYLNSEKVVVCKKKNIIILNKRKNEFLKTLKMLRSGRYNLKDIKTLYSFSFSKDQIK